MDALPALLRAIEVGELGDPLAPLAYVAGQTVELEAAELAGSRRRALLLRAAGGDPRREPEIDEPAVRLLARELHSELRLEQLRAALDALAPLARELPAVREAVLFLAADPDLAWRLLMVALLAEELDEQGCAAEGAVEPASG